MIQIKLATKTLPGMYRGDFKGRQANLYIVDSMTIPMDAGLWSSGYRDVYSGIQGRITIPMPFDQSSGPFGNHGRVATKMILGQGRVIIRRSDLGTKKSLTFYCSADDAKAIFGVDVPPSA